MRHRLPIGLTIVAIATAMAIRHTAVLGQTRTRPTADPKASFAEPGLSPDGSEIAFVSAGDIWAVPARGGEARLLISNPAVESRPLYSPDGTRLAFMSDRAGRADIWILTLATGAVRRLTFDDGAEQIDAWSRDGAWIYFSTSAHDIAGMNDVYRVRAAGGTPMPVAADRYASEFMSAPSPDGKATAIVGRGNGLSQWWRKGRSHLDESELWLVRDNASGAPVYEPLTPRGAKQQWPMWSADGKSLYFVSDRNGTQNLWIAPLGSEARPLTTFTHGRVLWPSMAANGRTMAFERDFGIWTYDVSSNRAQAVPIVLRGAASESTEHLSLTTGFSDLALSPDGKKVAFVAHGEVFAASAADGGDALRATRTPAAEGQVNWAGDSRRVAYSANREGYWHVYLYDFGTNTETSLTNGSASDVQPRFSPDGKSVAYVRDGRELCVLALDTKQVRVLAQGAFGRQPMLMERPIAWSPDGRWIAFLSAGTKLFVNVHVVAASGGEARQVSWLSNTRATSLTWSPDGSYLLLDTGMRTELGQLARIDLLPHTPKFREDQFTALFRDEVPGRTTPSVAPALPAGADTPRDETGLATPDPRNVRIVFDDIRTRLTIVPVGLDVNVQAISPDGKQVLVTAAVGGQPNIFLYSLDELSNEPAVVRQLTKSAGGKSSVQFAPDGKSVWYIEQGRITSAAIDTGTTKTLAVRAELDIDFAREKWEVFHQAWEFLNDNFYDPQFHGADWNAEHASYAPFIAGSRTPDEMRRVLSLMIGELNASHMGISPPSAPGGTPPVTGRLGLEFDRAAFEASGALRVTRVIPLGPAAVSSGISVGDVVLAIDSAGMAPDVSIDSLLAFKVGKRVVLTIASGAAGGNRREVAVRAVSAAVEKGLLYRAWVEERRAMVATLSNGRLGYLHMLDMGAGAIAQMNLDLDAENHAKEGIVLDIRNNNGGFVNGHALDVLARKPYVDMDRRGLSSVPGRPVLGQRALGAPTILLTNQHTLSDGENFTEGYRTMGLGKVVGEPTAGWDVYTGSGTMVDGTTVRLPFMRNAQVDQAALELVPRKVDLRVDRPMGESYGRRDVQVEAAVKELLAQIGASRAQSQGKRP